ncbi:hypothetical protein M670_01316 [Schinkia azotoformans MEV2011]|uniref:Uncharacterized protein n=1 Tax=Schinkia azotoformans MEV2011 TaxID=1348973 RepID=A0A072NRM6_SCHAZ|nr:hypothetical protein [Schinkia azotoformans]KEF39543.1 hypothetical protein M670_01316 [Schinkia azotoformans MEV2011]MEC1694233.1 hypothetical protein [Schinkia azotoformans]MEC1714966.1 hypothetical protein [Schinkia azotoformans]MEC1723553.1 hypothetical protein [Schinkia azotoformans]MEC1740199.1 hypothetical protein [Schinkia azotoformans]
MKKIIIITIFMIISVLTGCVSQVSPQEVIKKDENTFTISVPINVEVMNDYKDFLGNLHHRIRKMFIITEI